MSSLDKIRTVVESIVMPRGWHKPEKDRRGVDLPEPIRASSYVDLIAAVTKYRVDNEIALGDVKREINDYICDNWPHMCHEFPADQVTISYQQTAGDVPPKTLTEEVLTWMSEATTNHAADDLVLPEEARRRAEICSTCPKNKKLPSSCSSCIEAVDRMSVVLRNGKSTPKDKKLGVCTVLSHENRAAVWLRKDKLRTSDQLPSHCWLHKDSKP